MKEGGHDYELPSELRLPSELWQRGRANSDIHGGMDKANLIGNGEVRMEYIQIEGRDVVRSPISNTRCMGLSDAPGTVENEN